MVSRILSRRKWMLRAHDQHIVVVKGRQERLVHPLMKAFIWALYLPDYPTATIEVRIGDKYKPDVIAFSNDDPFQDAQPIFWGEAGRTGKHKIESLVRRFPRTHFVMSKWDRTIRPFVDLVQPILADHRRDAPFDIINFPESTMHCVDDDGNIHITHDDVEWVRLSGSSS